MSKFQQLSQKRPLRLVVCGQAGSGKSSVINALLRAPILPVGYGKRTNPITLVRQATGSNNSTDTHDKAKRIVSQQTGMPGLHETLVREVQSNAEILEKFEIIELPDFSSGLIDDHSYSMMVDADVLLWVTPASGAWQSSEKKIFQMLPADLAQRSIIAVSRADKLRQPQDWDKIHLRLVREAGCFFREAVFFSASKGALAAASESDEIWQITGGYLLSKILHEFAEMRLTEAESNIVAFPAA